MGNNDLKSISVALVRLGLTIELSGESIKLRYPGKEPPKEALPLIEQLKTFKPIIPFYAKLKKAEIRVVNGWMGKPRNNKQGE